MTHAELLAEVLERAGARGLACIVAHGARSTPGVTDLVLVAHFGIGFAEVKSVDGRRTRAQIAFSRRVESTGARYFLIRPADLESGKVDEWMASLSRD